jgi:hypothetical protein
VRIEAGIRNHRLKRVQVIDVDGDSISDHFGEVDKPVIAVSNQREELIVHLHLLAHKEKHRCDDVTMLFTALLNVLFAPPMLAPWRPQAARVEGIFRTRTRDRNGIVRLPTQTIRVTIVVALYAR